MVRLSYRADPCVLVRLNNTEFAWVNLFTNNHRYLRDSRRHPGRLASRVSRPLTGRFISSFALLLRTGKMKHTQFGKRAQTPPWGYYGSSFGRPLDAAFSTPRIMPPTATNHVVVALAVCTPATNNRTCKCAAMYSYSQFKLEECE